MASPSSLLPEENLSCSTCLGVFTGPVNLQCGHNFCGACVATRWDGDVQSRCPACAERSPAGRESRDDALTPEAAQRVGDAAVGPGEVFCHVCTGPKRKALKSCLECATSFCGAHLEPHHRAPGLRRHKLIRPEHDLEDRVCERHGRPLELFCKTDRTCVCELCTESDHRDHAVAPLEEEYGARKAELGETASELEGMILERRRRIEEIKLSVELGRENADREEASGAWFFTALKLSVDRYRAEHRERIREERESAEKRAEGLVGELEREIEKLADRSSELKRLSLAKDHLHLLRSFQSLNAPPPTRDWTTFELSRPSYAGTLRRALALLEEALKTKLLEAELRILQQHEVDLTLDPDTANPYLTLSEDGKQVYDGDVRKKVPDNPERFSKGACVFTKQSFSRGRFYFEVGVRGKSCWTLGVVRESINRKGDVILKPEYGCWTIWLRNGNEYQALSSPFVPLSLRAKPQKVGVFVDYDEGLVSFYDAESRVHIHSFTGCAFEEPLYPFLSPSLNDGGKNSAPLIISPVSQTH